MPDYDDEDKQQCIDPAYDQPSSSSEPATAASVAEPTEPTEPTESTASAEQMYKDYFTPPSQTTWPLPGSTPPWAKPIQLGPDPSSLGQPGATSGGWSNYAPPSTQLSPQPILPAAGGAGVGLPPLAQPAPDAATRALPPAQNYGKEFKLPPGVTNKGLGGTVGGQTIGGAPAFSTDDSRDLGKPPVGDPRNPAPQ